MENLLISASTAFTAVLVLNALWPRYEPLGRAPFARAGMKPRVARHPGTLGLMRMVPLSLVGVAACKRADSICRTAVYVTRMHGGVGGGGREALSYPDWPS